MRGPSRLVCCRPRTENSRSTQKTDRDDPRHRWESPACASGYKCMYVADGREQANEKTAEREVRTTNQEDRNSDSETCVPGGDMHDYGVRIITHVARDKRTSGTRTSSQRERGDGRARNASHGETHLIIARFRHLAPALNNALPLTHSLLPPLSIRPLCASLSRRDEKSMARLIARSGIISRCVRRVASAPCPPPYGAASHVATPPEVHSLLEREILSRTYFASGRNNRHEFARPMGDETVAHTAIHALLHGRINERRAAFANKIRTRPHSTAPD